MSAADALDAAAMIAEEGQTVSLAGITAQTYNPVTGTPSSTAYAATAKAVLLPLLAYRKLDHTNLVGGEETMLLAAYDTAGVIVTQPPVDSIVTLADGSKRTLVAVDPLRPDGTTIFFDCVVRGRV